jgi:hypothetical protein
MSSEKTKTRDLQPTVLRIDPALRHRLMRDAIAHGRSLNKEIELLLKAAIEQIDGAGYSTSQPTPPYVAREPEVVSGGRELSALQLSMLELFDRLPPEKQLALLSLFK